MRTFLFLFRAYPDVDHISPLVWKCLEQGDRAVAVFERAFPYADDYRIRWLQRYPGLRIVHLRGVESPSRPVAFASRLIWTPSRARALLQRLEIDACIFEWGWGGVGPRERNLTLRQRVDRLRRLGLRLAARDARRALRDVVKPLRSALILAARRAGVPTFCLPHGMRTILDPAVNASDAERLRRHGGEDPREDNNCFTVYVVNTAHFRELLVRHYRFDPRTTETWGSLRFCPEWRRLVKEICPPASLPPRRSGQLRAVFFLPKWHHFVDEAGTLALLRSLAEREDLQLVIKGHPRKGRAELGAAAIAELAARPNVVLAGDRHSNALIDVADATILLVSSLAVESLLQRKPVVQPAYLHRNRLIYDGYPGCVTPRSLPEVHGWLDRMARGEGPGIDDAAVAAVERDLVYGGREPFDVPEFYYRRILSHLPAPRGALAAAAP